MIVYLIDEEENFLKLVVVEGSPFSVSWTSKVFYREKSGKWKFVSKTTFDCSIKSGVSFTVRNKNHKVLRFYVQKVV